MSQEDKEYTQVLLPAAKVTIFARERASMDALMALGEDWRFARVMLEALEGDVDAAIATYKAEPSPDLVIIETEEINEGFTQKLEELAGFCSENTAAIVVGPVNDVNLYRKLIGMGVSDYLVRPLHSEVLGNDIAATLLERIGSSGSRLIAMMGSKGGVGTTSLAQAMAWGISDRLGQKTFLMDTAAGWSTMSVGMVFEPATTLAEAIRASVSANKDSLNRMFHKPTEKLHVLSSGGDVMLDDVVEPDKVEGLLDYLLAVYPVVIVDLSGSSAKMKSKIITRANEIVLVSTPTLPSLRAALTLISEMKDLRGGSDSEIDLVVNMQGIAPKQEVSKAEIEKVMKRKVSAFIPFEPGIFLNLESEGKSITEHKDGADIVHKLLPLARRVVSADVDAGAAVAQDEKKGGLGQLINKLTAKS